MFLSCSVYIFEKKIKERNTLPSGGCLSEPHTLIQKCQINSKQLVMFSPSTLTLIMVDKLSLLIFCKTIQMMQMHLNCMYTV